MYQLIIITTIIAIASCKCITQADIVFLVDGSTSMTPNDFQVQLQFCIRLLLPSNIDSGDVRVGFMLFSTKSYIQFHLNAHSSKDDVISSILKSKFPMGSTNIADALEVMTDEMFTPKNGDRIGIKNTAILITDGISNIKREKTYNVAKRAKAIGIQLIVIGIGDVVDYDKVSRLASLPSLNNAFVLKGYNRLRIFDERFFGFCPVEDPMVACKNITTWTIIWQCRIWNMWNINCQDIVWKYENDTTNVYRMGEYHNFTILCEVRDSVSLVTSIKWENDTFVESASMWTAEYSKYSGKQTTVVTGNTARESSSTYLLQFFIFLLYVMK